MPPPIAYIAMLIPILALLIPIVAILTQHQRQMAELLHRSQPNQHNAEMEALRREVLELKQLVHEQAIAMDNVVSLQTRPTTVQERIGNGVS